MKLVTVQGTLGSGKTTLIRRLIAHMTGAGKRSAVIVNEDGEEGYSENFLAKNDLRLEKMRGG